MALRYYQREAIDAIFSYWQEDDGHPLVDMATGTGKSITMATLTQELVQGWPDLRVMNIAHREELVEGNFGELVSIWPFAPVGIFAAALGRRDARAQILFSQIQTVYNKASDIGHVDVLEIDEVHLVPSNEATMYGTLIRELLAINPDMKLVGFTATPYRMDDGRLDEGENRMFDKVVYTYGIGQGVDDGYLAPLSSKGMETGFDLTGVGTLGGDYKKGALAAAVDKEEVTRQAVAEAVAYASRLGKKTALFFCSGVDHAHHVRDEVRTHGLTCETIHGMTPKSERRRILADYKAGRLWGVSNDAVLTVGTNVPNIDMIADLAPTKSAPRYVQKAGRGTRPIYVAGFVDREDTTAEERRAAIASGPKPSCLYLDYAKNVSFHGPVDRAQPKTPGKGCGDAPVKICPECEELVHISVMKCPCCDYDFPPSADVKITTQAATTPIMSTEKDMWRAVTSRRFAEHPGKEGKPPSVKATFMCGFLAVNNWLCPGHSGFAKTKADRFWMDHGGRRPFPANVEAWLMRQHELNDTAEIEIEYNGKYPNARNYKAALTATAAEPEEEYVPAGHTAQSYAALLDDEIPF